MANINSVNNTLSGQSGTGKFLGSEDSIIDSSDFSTATSLKITNSSSPVISSAGDMAIKTSITSFNGMVTYRDSSSSQLGIGIPSSVLASASDGDVVGYNSSSSTMTLITPPERGSLLAGYAVGTATSDSSTSSTTYANTNLTVSYTPTNSTSLLWITAYGYCQVSQTSGTNSPREAIYGLRRTTGSAADLYESSYGADIPSASGLTIFYFEMKLSFLETAGDTASHTYIIRNKVASGFTGLTTLESARNTSYINVWEFLV